MVDPRLKQYGDIAIFHALAVPPDLNAAVPAVNLFRGRLSRLTANIAQGNEPAVTTPRSDLTHQDNQPLGKSTAMKPEANPLPIKSISPVAHSQTHRQAGIQTRQHSLALPRSQQSLSLSRHQISSRSRSPARSHPLSWSRSPFRCSRPTQSLLLLTKIEG
ncbi:hypothetical protein N7490_004312 [Penicillium lividum]|nr:hypothetical protein N7490_004312 [Penicillium lividum]